MGVLVVLVVVAVQYQIRAPLQVDFTGSVCQLTRLLLPSDR